MALSLKTDTGRWSRAAGLLLLMFTVLIWVGSSILVQFIFQDLDFDRPFFVTYISTGLFGLYLFGFVRRSWREPQEPQGKRSLRDVLRISCKFCPLWVAANWSFNASLSMTSVSSGTILSSTSSLFTFLLGLGFLGDRFDWSKLAAVVFSLGGVSMIAFSDEQQAAGGSEDTVLGDLLSVISALCYGIYTVLLRREIPEERAVRMTMFFGLVGLINVVTLWPLFLILHYAGIESAVAPWAISGELWAFLLLNGIVGSVLSDLCWALSVLLTTPLIATVGLSLTIPIAMLADFLMHGKAFGGLYILGTLLVFVGFLIVNLDVSRWVMDRWQRRRRRQQQHLKGTSSLVRPGAASVPPPSSSPAAAAAAGEPDGADMALLPGGRLSE